MIVNLQNIKKRDLNENKGNVASDPKAKKIVFQYNSTSQRRHYKVIIRYLP